MSDKFSIDDILEEYSAKKSAADKDRSDSAAAEPKKDIDLEEIIGQTKRETVQEKTEDKPVQDLEQPVAADSEKRSSVITAESIVEAANALPIEEEPPQDDDSGEEQAEQENRPSAGMDLNEVKFDKNKKNTEKKKSRINTSVIERMVMEKKSGSGYTPTGAIPPVNRASVKDIDMDLEVRSFPRPNSLRSATTLPTSRKWRYWKSAASKRCRILFSITTATTRSRKAERPPTRKRKPCR